MTRQDPPHDAPVWPEVKTIFAAVVAFAVAWAAFEFWSR